MSNILKTLVNNAKLEATHAVKNKIASFKADHDTSGGRYVNNHKFIDKNKAGVRRTDSRLRDVYNQKDQEAVNVNYSGKPTTFNYIVATVIALFGLFAYFALFPKLGHMIFFDTFFYKFTGPLTFGHVFKGLCFGGICFGITLGYFYIINEQNAAGHNAAKQMKANDYNDSHIAVPEELAMNHDIVPDTKVHFDTDVTAVLSHVMLRNTVQVHGKDGNVHFDNDFSEKMFDIAGLPNNNQVRKLLDPAKLLYNPNHKHGKLDEATVLDLINHHWYVPEYEDPDSQDPAGGYIVSTAPENTIVVAQTRGGKGQKYINIIIDIWSRQKKLPNIIMTDLKMELLKMNLKMLNIRGYNVKSLNLMNADKTDAINFILYAAEAGTQGDVTRMESLVQQISDIFFGNDSKSGQDPFWNNSASAAFKRTIYFLIDYYYEAVRRLQENPTLSQAEINQKTDELWGKCTLYNAYKFMIDASSKTYPQEKYKDIYTDSDGDFPDSDPEATSKSGMTIYADATEALPKNPIRDKIANQDKLIRSVAQSEKTLANIYGICLTGMVFFTDDSIIKLTSARPSENLDLDGFSFPRRFGLRFDKYQIKKRGYNNAQFVWQAFHDVAMTKPYLKEYNGKQVLDKDYFYEGGIDSFGWIKGLFKGKFTDDVTYIKVSAYDATSYVSHVPDDKGRIKDSSNFKLDDYNFAFTKSYRRSFSGKTFLINPLTGLREVQNGILEEYNYNPIIKQANKTRATFPREEYSLIIDHDSKVTRHYPIIKDMSVHYADKPIAFSLVAPPTTASYNKILLITVDLIASQQQVISEQWTPNQKPYVPTKYLFDEFGNMQSGGKGVPNIEEKLSAGLGSEQQFTLILQSMKQLEAVYGNNVGQILSANVTSYVFLKSKDQELIKFLMAMNGKTHRIILNNESFSRPVSGYHMLGLGGKNSQESHPQITETRTKQEQDIISMNDYLNLVDDPADGNAIVSRGGDPIWSQGYTIMPMSFALLANRTGGEGEEYTNTYLPTLANTIEFNPLANIPDTTKMIARRIKEASIARQVMAEYKKVNNLTDMDIQQIDAETYANTIMRGIYANIQYNDKHPHVEPIDPFNIENDYKRDEQSSSYAHDQQVQESDKAINDLNDTYMSLDSIVDKVDTQLSENNNTEDSIDQDAKKLSESATSNTNLNFDETKLEEMNKLLNRKCFANNQLSVGSFVQIANLDKNSKLKPYTKKNTRIINKQEDLLLSSYNSNIDAFKALKSYVVGKALDNQGGKGNQNLYHYDKNDNPVLFIKDNSDNDGKTANETDRYEITDDFIYFLINKPTWSTTYDVPKNFDIGIANLIRQNENSR